MISLPHFRQIRQHLNDSPIWVYATLFALSFIPSLISHVSVHAIGAYVEWFVTPFFTLLCISAYIHQRPLVARYLHYSVLFSFFLLTAIAMVYLLLRNYTYDGRLSIFYDSPNQFAMYFLPLSILACGYIIPAKKIPRLVSYSLIIFTIFVLIMTQSFTAFFALLLSLYTTLLVFTKRKYITLLIIPLIVICLSAFGYIKYINSEFQWSHNSLGSRVAIWQSAIYSIQKSPLVGYEIDSFQREYLGSQKYFPPFPEWAVPTPHNIFFALFFSGGFFATLFFLLMIAKIQTQLYILYKKTAHQFALYQFATMCSFIFLGFFDTPIWKIDLSFIFWLTVVLCLFTIHHSNFSDHHSKPQKG
jgi:O-antigen ligase